MEAEDGAAEEEAEGEEGGACSSDDDDDPSPPPPRYRRGAELVASLPLLWASPGGALRPLVSHKRSFTVNDVADALGRAGQLTDSTTTVYRALAHLVTSGALVLVGAASRGRKTRYALAPAAPSGGDGSGGGGAGAEAAAGDAADGGDAAHSSSDDASSDDGGAAPQPDAAASPDRARPQPARRDAALLARAIPRLWAHPHGALLPLLSERRSFASGDVADALRLPRGHATNGLVNTALKRLVLSKQLNRVGGSQHEGWRYAPSRATNSDGGGCGNAADAATDEAGAEDAVAAVAAAAAVMPCKRKHPGRRRKARAAALSGAAAAGASAADWALVDPPPRVDEIGGDSVGAAGALRFHLRDSITRKEMCVVAEMPPPAGGGCGAARRRIFRITRAGALLAPPYLRAALLPRASDVRDWMAAVVESRLLGGAEPDAATSWRFAVDPSPEPFTSAGEEDDIDAPGVGAAEQRDAHPPKKRLRRRPGEMARGAAARATAAAAAAPAQPTKAALVMALVEALVALPHGAMYRHSFAHGFFVAADVEAALRGGGGDEAAGRSHVNISLSALVSRGVLAAHAGQGTQPRKWYKVVVAAAAAGAAAPPAPEPTQTAVTEARVDALISPPSGPLYRLSASRGFFVCDDVEEALRADGGGDVPQRIFVNTVLRALTARGALSAWTDEASGTRNWYAVLLPLRPIVAAAEAAAALAIPPPLLPPQEVAPATVKPRADPSASWGAQLAAARRGLLRSCAAAFDAPPRLAALPPGVAASLALASAAADAAAGQRGPLLGAAAAPAQPSTAVPASAPLLPCVAALDVDIPGIDDLSGDEGGGDENACKGAPARFFASSFHQPPRPPAAAACVVVPGLDEMVSEDEERGDAVLRDATAPTSEAAFGAAVTAAAAPPHPALVPAPLPSCAAAQKAARYEEGLRWCGGSERRNGGGNGNARGRTRGRSRSRSRSRERAHGRRGGRSEGEGRTSQRGGSHRGTCDASPPPMSRPPPPALRTVLPPSRPIASGDDLFCYADANDPSVSHGPFSLATFASWAAQGGETAALLRQLSVWPAGGGAEGGLQKLAVLLDSLVAQT